MKQVKVFVHVDDSEVGLLFQWNEDKNCWICEMEDWFMKELGPLPIEEES